MWESLNGKTWNTRDVCSIFSKKWRIWRFEVHEMLWFLLGPHSAEKLLKCTKRGVKKRKWEKIFEVGLTDNLFILPSPNSLNSEIRHL